MVEEQGISRVLFSVLIVPSKVFVSASVASLFAAFQHVVRVVCTLAPLCPACTAGVVILARFLSLPSTQSVLLGLPRMAWCVARLLVGLLSHPVAHRGVEADKVPSIPGARSSQHGAAVGVAADLLGVVPHQLQGVGS